MTWGEHLFDAELQPIASFDGEWFVLSNFWRGDVVYNDVSYPTAEHAYQAAKATSTKDHDYVASSLTPAIAKHRGREIKCRSDWNQVKIDVMRRILEIKFSLDTHAGARLLLTGERQLIEGNTWGDKVWGVCTGEGDNRLGQLLMEIRFKNAFSKALD